MLSQVCGGISPPVEELMSGISAGQYTVCPGVNRIDRGGLAFSQDVSLPDCLAKQKERMNVIED